MKSDQLMQLQLCLMTLLLVLSPTLGLMEGLYCGTDNCYDLLEVSRDATKGEITKAYRKLARKWHPDMHKKKSDKAKAETMFQKIAGAYETLRDEESRTDYDYMLDNPDEYYRHYYYYYRRRVTPKVDVRIVIAVTITIISAIQYWSAWNNYNTAIAYLTTLPKYRMQAQEIARSQGLLEARRKKDRSKTKEEIKEEEENILRRVIEKKMDIRGGYQKPHFTSVLWFQLILSPYYLLCYIYWWLHWIWKFYIMKEEYGMEEKEYLIRKNMKISQNQFDSMEDHEREKFIRLELWNKEKFQKWKAEQEEEMKAKLADNSKYKMYRRYMKKGGPGQMSFGPE